jgi:Fe-S-cluster containining protein
MPSLDLLLDLGEYRMIPIPWRNVKSWNCVGCGMCCIDYHVVLNFKEWITIVKKYGADAALPTVGKLLLGKNNDGTCRFLTNFAGNKLCGLQYMKPLACKIWPFKVFYESKFGNPKKALFHYRERDFFVYVDPACNGLTWGNPDSELKFRTLPEFIDVAIGLRERQVYSTSKVNCQQDLYQLRGRNVI